MPVPFGQPLQPPAIAFAAQKDAPTASEYALQFLRKHPEVASESVVWHTHDLTGDKPKEPRKIEYKYI